MDGRGVFVYPLRLLQPVPFSPRLFPAVRYIVLLPDLVGREHALLGNDGIEEFHIHPIVGESELVVREDSRIVARDLFCLHRSFLLGLGFPERKLLGGHEHDDLLFGIVHLGYRSSESGGDDEFVLARESDPSDEHGIDILLDIGQHEFGHDHERYPGFLQERYHIFRLHVGRLRERYAEALPFGLGLS